jgi:rhodanese-related sulfurtransferase
VGSVNAPVYVNDDSASLGNLMKQLAAFGTGGWWQGGGHMKANPDFLSTVQSKIPFTSKVVVSCQKGLRSLAAAEMLVKTGYTEVAWLSGGYDSATKADFDTTNGKDMRHGTVAGVRGIIGWTPVQQEEGNAVAGGIYKFLGYVAIFAAANFASMGVQIWQAGGVMEAFNK